MHRIIIADGHPSVRRALRNLFDANGFEVCGEAVNGREAVEKAQELRPDLVLLDYCMPVMDGLQAARVLTTLMPDMPVVMLTGYMGKFMEEEARDAGIRRLISKEKAHDTVVPSVREVLV